MDPGIVVVVMGINKKKRLRSYPMRGFHQQCGTTESACSAEFADEIPVSLKVCWLVASKML